jgi:hypothetical protein
VQRHAGTVQYGRCAAVVWRLPTVMAVIFSPKKTHTALLIPKICLPDFP